MIEGLWAIAIWQGNVMVLRVAWLRHVSGDEWAAWWVTPYRGETSTRLTQVWIDGPIAAPKWAWSNQVESVVLRLHMVPLAKLDPQKWERVCPKPKGWVDE